MKRTALTGVGVAAVTWAISVLSPAAPAVAGATPPAASPPPLATRAATATATTTPSGSTTRVASPTPKPGSGGQMPTFSRHVRLSPAANQAARAGAYVRGVGGQTRISVEARGLGAGQRYALLVGTSPRCDQGSQTPAGTLTGSSPHQTERIGLRRPTVRSLELRDPAGRVVACGRVRRHGI